MQELEIIRQGAFSELALRVKIGLDSFMIKINGEKYSCMGDFKRTGKVLKSNLVWVTQDIAEKTNTLLYAHDIDCSDPMSRVLDKFLCTFESYLDDAAMASQIAQEFEEEKKRIGIRNPDEIRREAVNLFEENLNTKNIPGFQAFMDVDRGQFLPSSIPLEDILADYGIDQQDFNPKHVIHLVQQLASMGFTMDETDNSAKLITPYIQMPVLIGNKQNCSAPFIVLMYNFIHHFFNDDANKILDLGTGCGYHLANTGMMHPDAKIFTTEHFQDLSEKARTVLQEKYPDIAKRVTFFAGNAANPEFTEELRANEPFDYAYSAFDFVDEERLKPYLQMLNEKKGVLIAPLGNDLMVYYRQGRTVYRASLASVTFGEIVQYKPEEEKPKEITSQHSKP